MFAVSSLQGAPARTFLSPGTAATQIKLWEVSVRVCMHKAHCVCFSVCSQLLPLQVLQTGVTHCVSLKPLYKVIATTSDRFNPPYFFFFSPNVSVCDCVCVCVWQFIGGYCSAGLCGPPTEAPFSEQQMEKERQGSQSRRDTTSRETHAVLDCRFLPSHRIFFQL